MRHGKLIFKTKIELNTEFKCNKFLKKPPTNLGSSNFNLGDMAPRKRPSKDRSSEKILDYAGVDVVLEPGSPSPSRSRTQDDEGATRETSNSNFRSGMLDRLFITPIFILDDWYYLLGCHAPKHIVLLRLRV